MSRLSAYYSELIERFRQKASEEVLGFLTTAHAHTVEAEQLLAWQEEIELLKDATEAIDGMLFIEFDIPRLGSRVDAVVIAGPGIFPIEFKCGATGFTTSAYNQVWDYALDLKNFHATSHDPPIFPILVATRAGESDSAWQPSHPDGVRPPRRCGARELRRILQEGLALATGPALNADLWGRGAYEPTPTIVEAAQALYARHSVEAISRKGAEAKDLEVTSRRVEQIIERARSNGEKAIVFVTGVPGAGKTLVGLNVATRRQVTHDVRSVYLSGNGPLVAVLQEALTRDEHARVRSTQPVGEVRRKVKLFIQNVHTFRDEGVRDREKPPYDHVVIFDEAQRAWDRQKTANFMLRRKGVRDFKESEPEFLISYLARHESWAVVVCLVGGGQEIHTGEAGISEWLDAVRTRFTNWRVHVSRNLADSEYGAQDAIGQLKAVREIDWDDDLHLSTNMRSFRSAKVSAFVKATLACDVVSAQQLLKEVAEAYPIVITRDLSKAKAWVRSRARGSERYGLIASSEAQRLKAHGIDIRAKVDPVHWFLKGPHDTRSSYFLEDAATEFQVQGLEVDWACVTWDADLRFEDKCWRYHSFRGDKWQQVKKSTRQRYLLNAYRVLLTRARQGMAIFVPEGDRSDPTRPPAFYDKTYEYLASLGLPGA